jgi:hypothetical protein
VVAKDKQGAAYGLSLPRALLHIRMPQGLVDERGFNFLRRMREEAAKGLTLSVFKKMVREQFFMCCSTSVVPWKQYQRCWTRIPIRRPAPRANCSA